MVEEANERLSTTLKENDPLIQNQSTAALDDTTANCLQVETEEMSSKDLYHLSKSDYQKWLRVQKLKWKNAKIKRGIENRTGGSTNLVRGVRDSLYKNTWEVIQIVAAETPGEFMVWSLVGNRGVVIK